MKKVFLSFILSLSLLIGCTVSVFASAPRNGYWSTYVNRGVKVSYDELSEMLTYCNQAINQGTWDWPYADLTTYHPVARISSSTDSYGTYYYIKVSYNDSVAKSQYNYYYSAREYKLNGTVWTANYYTYYAVPDSEDPLTLKPLYDRLGVIGTALNSIDTSIHSIQSSCNSIVGYVDGVESKLDNLITLQTAHYPVVQAGLSSISGYVDGLESSASSISNKLSYTVSGRTYSLAELAYLVSSDLDSISTYLGTIYSSINLGNSRMIKSVNDTTYTLADLQYNAWQRLVTIAGYVDGLDYTISGRTYTTAELLYLLHSDIDSLASSLGSLISLQNSRMIKIVDQSSYTIADLLYNIWGNTTSQSSTLTDIYTAIQDNSNYPFCIVSASSIDGNGDDWPRSYVPYESGTDIVANLNNTYQNRKIKLLSNSNVQSNRWFVRADLSDQGYIRVYCTASQTSTVVAQFYLCDTKHNLIVSKPATYLSSFASLESAINQVSIDVTNSTTNNSTNITTLLTPITTIVSATANIEVGIDDINLNIGSLIDHLDLGFGDVVDAVEAIPESTYKTGKLYISSYATDSQGVAYDTIVSPYSSTTDIIGYINSQMVGQPIIRLPRRGVREGELTCYVDHAWLDSNNYIRVDALTVAGEMFSYFLCSPELALFTSLLAPSEPDYTDIIPYIDNIESQLSTIDQHLNTLDNHIVDINNTSQSILNYLDNQQFVPTPILVSYLSNYSTHIEKACNFDPSVYVLFYTDFTRLQIPSNWFEIVTDYAYNPTHYSYGGD